MSLTAEFGKVLALVGPLEQVKALCLSYYKGFMILKLEIYVSGVSIRQMATFYLRDEIAIVPQQPALFSNNVYHNIRYGNPSATDEEVVAAAKKAHAHEFILGLPDGYMSFLGDKGVQFWWTKTKSLLHAQP